VWTFGEMILYPSMLDHISAISPHRLKARNMGFYSAGMNLGVLVAPLLFLPLSSVLTSTVSWGLVGALLLVGLVAVSLLSSSGRTWGADQPRVLVER
jgi:MFS family permease